MTVFTPTNQDGARRTSDRDTETDMTTDRDDRRSNRADPNRTDSTRSTSTRTMGGVSHTNPVTGESFGESQVFTRGRTIVADGGEAEGVEESEEDTEQAADDEDVATVKDVDHTPREGAPDTSAVYERGGEGKTEPEDGEPGDVSDADEDAG